MSGDSQATPSEPGSQPDRQLRRTAGWVMLWGLGVSYVISGDFAGWNFGLAKGGFGGLLIAMLIAATMYAAICLALAELASIVPAAGGGFGFARRALGPWGGFLTGIAVLIEYAIAPAAIVTFIGAYVNSLVGIDGWPVYLVFYAVVIAIHMRGAGESLGFAFVVTVVAMIALVVFVVAMIPKFDAANLTNIAAGGSGEHGGYFPFGPIGVWAAVPFALWFFLAVEGVPMAAEEAREPTRDVPRGLIAAILTLIVTAAAILLLATGGGGANQIKDVGDPLLDAIRSPLAFGHKTVVFWIVNIAGLAGLVASFFSIIFGYSRLTFSLARAGYLPQTLGVLNGRRVPYLALLVPGAVGFGLSLTGKGNLLILVAVFGACISYMLMMVAHIVLRLREPKLARPYRTPGGIITSSVALLLAAAAAVSGFLVEHRVLAGTVIVYAILLAYFVLRGRHHIVGSAPEELGAATRDEQR